MSRPWQQLHRAWMLLITVWAPQEGRTYPLHYSIPQHFEAKVQEGSPQGNQ